MQGLLSGVAAGLSIIFSRHFRVGEYISLASEEGQVMDITLFSTTLAFPQRELRLAAERPQTLAVRQRA